MAEEGVSEDQLLGILTAGNILVKIMADDDRPQIETSVLSIINNDNCLCYWH